MSREMAVAVAPSGGGQVIDRVSLVPIDGGRVLVVVSTDVGSTRTAVMTTDGTFRESELREASELFNDWLRGTTLSRAAATLKDRAEQLDEPPGQWLSGLLDVMRAFLNPSGGERIHYEGARYMFRHPEFSSDAASLGEILDSEEALAEVVRGPERAAEVRVVIGEENARRGMSRMSLVTGTYRIGSSFGRMGIIGPTRMRYPRLISLVRYCSKALDDLLSE
jgi:heat-inducible transcriptional repressor